MRLNRLDLIRYGRFQDAALVFPKPQGRPDVTLVYGPNEAGKSTAFHGFLELLFGFKAGAHPYAFRFERSDLLVGADLDLPGREGLVLRRNGKRTRSLLDTEGRPLDEAILTSALHGLDREAYVERFSLNDDSLRRGGERIAGAQGDLGQLLHAGVSGLTGVAEVLDQLSARADQFHKKHGRGTVLKAQKDRLTEIARQIRADHLTVERERKLQHDRDAAQAAFEAADAQFRDALRRRAAAQAAQQWRERSEVVERADQALAEFPDGPDLPPGSAERVTGLLAACASHERRIADVGTEITALEASLADNPPDPLAEPLAAELARLDALQIDGAPLIGRATTARADLARRQTEQAEADRQIDAVLAQLTGGRSEPRDALAALVLSPDGLDALDQAVQEQIAAGQTHASAAQAVDSARAQLGEAPRAPQDLTALRRAFEAWQAVADLALAKAARDQAQAQLTRAASTLPQTWRARVADGLPARESLDDLARDWSTLTADLAAARKDLDARQAELAQARADLDAETATAEAVDLARTEDTRRRRDIAWARHRDGLSANSAERFEAAMYADDHARAAFLTGAEARQRLRTAQTHNARAQAAHDTAKARHDTLVARRDCLADRCTKAAQALGLPQDSPASALAIRHQALFAASDAAADLDIAQAALNAQSAARQAALDALADAARAVAIDCDATACPDQVHRALTLEEADRKAWTAWQDARAALAELETKAAKARSEYERTTHALDALSAGLPLPQRAAETLRAALPHLRRLASLQAEREKLQTRIGALEHAIDALAISADALARIMEVPGTEQDDPAHIIDCARIRVTTAQRAGDTRAAEKARRAELLAAKNQATTALKAAQTELAACFAGQGGEDLPPNARLARLLERDTLRAERTAAERDRTRARDDVDKDMFHDELDRLPDASRSAELEQGLRDAQDVRDDALASRREAERLYQEAYQADDRSDLATEQATLLEELRDSAHQAALDRLGVLAARGALRRLAAERRSSMLRNVEHAFVTMTEPAWTGVDVWSQEDGEKLVGVQPGGGTVPVAQMSTGTMGQLYFALRLAGYRDFARAPGPLPMVLDDIMETFDDTRARAALHLCAEIGNIGQAILFTHHAHLVDLARDTIPDVAVLQMPR